MDALEKPSVEERYAGAVNAGSLAPNTRRLVAVDRVGAYGMAAAELRRKRGLLTEELAGALWRAKYAGDVHAHAVARVLFGAWVIERMGFVESAMREQGRRMSVVAHVVAATAGSVKVDQAITIGAGTHRLTVPFPDGTFEARRLTNAVGPTAVLTLARTFSAAPLVGSPCLIETATLVDLFACRVLHEWLEEFCPACRGTGYQEIDRHGRRVRPRGLGQRNARLVICRVCAGERLARPNHGERIRSMGITRADYSRDWVGSFAVARQSLVTIARAPIAPLTAALRGRNVRA